MRYLFNPVSFRFHHDDVSPPFTRMMTKRVKSQNPRTFEPQQRLESCEPWLIVSVANPRILETSKRNGDGRDVAVAVCFELICRSAFYNRTFFFFLSTRARLLPVRPGPKDFAAIHSFQDTTPHCWALHPHNRSPIPGFLKFLLSP